MEHFIRTSAAAGFKPDAFSHLSERDRRRLVRLMARIAEKSYRRGFQQGAALGADPFCRDELHEWRYRPSLDLSPWADSSMTETSERRLFMENGVLRELGFDERDDPRDGYRKPTWHGYSARKRLAIRQASSRSNHQGENHV